MNARRIDPAVLVILSGMVAALNIGKVPVAIPVLRDDLGISLVDAGFLLAAIQFCGMAMGVFIGVATDAIGLRRSLVLGHIILATAGLLGAWATHPGMILATRGLEGLGFLLSILAAPPLIRQLVPLPKMAQYLAFWGTYMPTGAATALLGGSFLTSLIGWRGLWVTLALLSAAMAFWIVAVVPAASPRPANAAALPGESMRQRLRLALGTPAVWFLALAFAMYSSQWLAVIGFLPAIYEQAGIAKTMAGTMTAVVCLANVIGNVAAGRLLHRGLPARRLLFSGFVVMAGSTVLAFHPTTADWPALRFIAVFLFSAIGGLVPGSLFSLAVKVAPSEGTVSTTVGWMQQCSSTGQFFAPPALALLAATVGSWQYTWMATVVASALGMFFVSRLPGGKPARS